MGFYLFYFIFFRGHGGSGVSMWVLENGATVFCSATTRVTDFPASSNRWGSCTARICLTRESGWKASGRLQRSYSNTPLPPLLRAVEGFAVCWWWRLLCTFILRFIQTADRRQEKRRWDPLCVMVPRRTSALDNCREKCGRVRGLEAVRQQKAFCVRFRQLWHVPAACMHAHKAPVRQRAFAPAVPLKGFSREKPPLGFSKLMPQNSSTEEQNAKNTRPLRCKLARGPSVHALQRPSPPKQLQMEISSPSTDAARYAAPDSSVFMLPPFKCYIPALLAFSWRVRHEKK